MDGGKEAAAQRVEDESTRLLSDVFTSPQYITE